MKKFSLFSAVILILTGCVSEDMYSKPARESADTRRVWSTSADSAPALAKAASNSAGKTVANGNFQAPEGRQMTFTADITLNVLNNAKAIAGVREMTKKAGGYVITLENSRLELAIPVAKGDDFLNQLATMGEILNLRIRGNDVTDQVADLKIRIDNLEKSRKRLLILMDRTANVKDLTQVERELNRVTTELERLQTANKKLADKIAYTTITVRFQRKNTSVTLPESNVPLVWINDLGKGLQERIIVSHGRDQILPFSVKLPEKFIFAGGAYAVSGNNCSLRFRQVPNAVSEIRWYGNEYSKVDFYKDLILKSLRTKFTGKISCSEAVIDGKKAFIFRGETKIYNTDYLYIVAVAADKDKVKIAEAKGEKASLLADLPEENWQKMLKSIDF